MKIHCPACKRETENWQSTCLCDDCLAFVKGERSEAAQPVCSGDGLAGRESATRPEAVTSVVSGAKADSAATCQWIMWTADKKICGKPATNIVPHCGKTYCSRHAKRFYGLEDVEPLKPPTLPTASGSEARPANDQAKPQEATK